MAVERLQGLVHRFWWAAPNAFEDWQNPTIAEMNQNPENDPDGLIVNITCAVNTDGTTFDLGEGERDDSLTFCQVAGTGERMAENPEVTIELVRDRQRWLTTDANVSIANLAFSLLVHRGVSGFLIMSVGREPEAAVEEDDRLKIVGVTTDHGIDTFGVGENVRLQQTPALSGDVNWNFRVTA